eukprot:379045_1
MGCSFKVPKHRVLSTKSDNDINIHQEEMTLNDEYKCLLLGPTSSGKTTFCKQIKNIYNPDFFNNIMLAQAKLDLLQNIIYALQIISITSSDLNKQLKQEIIGIRDTLKNISYDDDGILLLKQHYYECIQLWNSTAFQETRHYLETHSEYNINDNIHYIVNKLDLYLMDDYIPTAIDLIHLRKIGNRLADDIELSAFYDIDINSRLAVSGYIRSLACIVNIEIPIEIKKLVTFYFDMTIGLKAVNTYEIYLWDHDNKRGYETITYFYDVGCFCTPYIEWIKRLQANDINKLDAIIYFTALSDYNKIICKDNETVNKLLYSIDKFGDIINLNYFFDSHKIVLLNKIDVFEKQITVYPINEYCVEFEGNILEKEQFIRFVKQKFRETQTFEDYPNTTDTRQQIMFHVTCMINTNSTKKLFENIENTIKRQDFGRYGFL